MNQEDYKKYQNEIKKLNEMISNLKLQNQEIINQNSILKEKLKSIEVKK